MCPCGLLVLQPVQSLALFLNQYFKSLVYFIIYATTLMGFTALLLLQKTKNSDLNSEVNEKTVQTFEEDLHIAKVHLIN